MNGFLAGARLSQFAQNQRPGRRHPLDQPIGPFRNPNIAKRHSKPSQNRSESFESQSETAWNHFRASRSPQGEGKNEARPYFFDFRFFAFLFFTAFFGTFAP